MTQDLVSKDIVEKWIKYLRNEFPTVAFKSSTQQQNKNLVRPTIHCYQSHDWHGNLKGKTAAQACQNIKSLIFRSPLKRKKQKYVNKKHLLQYFNH